LQAYKPGEFVTDALRNSKVKLTWDQDDPERLKLVRGAHPGKDKKQKGKGKQEEVIDYSALLASDSEDDGAKRSRLRAAFGLGETPLEEHEGDDSDDDDQKDVDMEVTFGPALDGEGDEELDEEDEAEKEETSLEAYQRKERERRERKKAKRLAEKKKGAGKGRVVLDQEDDSDPDEAFDANAFGEADGLDAEDGGVDAFFDGGVDGESENGQEALSSDKISKKAQRQLEREAKEKEAASLSLLMGRSDGEGSGDDDGKHFDMQAILRAEKVSSKPKKMLKKGKDRRKHDDAKKLLEREKDKFEIDLKDGRFSKLHEDHEFALDPSSNKCVSLFDIETPCLLRNRQYLTFCFCLVDLSRRRIWIAYWRNLASVATTMHRLKEILSTTGHRAQQIQRQAGKKVSPLLLSLSSGKASLRQLHLKIRRANIRRRSRRWLDFGSSLCSNEASLGRTPCRVE